MRLTIYYYENDSPESHSRGKRYTAFIPELPTSANGATREEARKAAQQEALEHLAWMLREGQATSDEIMVVDFCESTLGRTPQELADLARAHLAERENGSLADLAK